MSFLPDVRAAERRRFIYASLAFMCVASAGLVARTVGDTLFLTRFGSERLPLMYVVTAVLLALIAFGYSSGFARWSLSGILTTVVAVLVVLSLAVRFWVAGGTSASRVMAYLVAEVVIRMPLLLFWSVAALIFDAREAKRLVGGIGAAGTAACIVAGAAIPRLVHRAGTENLLWVQAALIAGFGILAVAAARSAPIRQPARVRQRRPPQLSYYFSLLENSQVRNLALLVAVATASLVLTDFVFKSEVRARFAGADLAAFFGGFYAFANGGALLLQLMAVHHMLARGVGFSLRLLPVALLIASAGMAAFNTLGWAVAAKFLEPLLEFTINAAAVQMLFLAVQRQTRTQARAVVDGLAKPAAIATAGGLLVVLTGVLAPQHVAAMVVLGAAAWLLLVQRNTRLYMLGLLESIGTHRFDLGAERVEFSDTVLAEHVRQALRSSRDEDIPYLLAILPQWKQTDWTSEYRLLLERPSAEIKIRCLEYLAQHGDPADGERVRRELQDEDPAVRRAAVQASMRVGGPGAAAWLLEAAREDGDASVRATAAAELIHYGDLDELIVGATTFRSMLASPLQEQRAAAARSLLVMERHTLTSTLRQLLEDPDPDVRLIALDAARSHREPALVPAIAALLREKRVGWKAAQILPAFGEAALERLEELTGEALADPPPRFAFHVPSVLEQIGPPALPQLHRLLDSPNLDLRHHAISAYCNLVRRHDVRDEHARIERLAEREIELAQAAAAARHASGCGNELLDLALSDEFEQHVDGLLHLLQVLQPRIDRGVLADGLREGGEQRAQAIEFLDNVLPGRVKPAVLALFESAAGVAAAQPPLSELLTRGSSQWVTIGALYCAGESRRIDLADAVRPYLDHHSSAVRETAQDALRKLGTGPVVHDEIADAEVTVV